MAATNGGASLVWENVNNLSEGASLACLPAAWNFCGCGVCKGLTRWLTASVRAKPSAWLCSCSTSGIQPRGPWWGCAACSPHSSWPWGRVRHGRPRAHWASVLWSVHIFHLAYAEPGKPWHAASSRLYELVLWWRSPAVGVGEVTLSPCVPTKGHFQLQTPGMDKEVTWAHCHLASCTHPAAPGVCLEGAPKCQCVGPGNGPKDQDRQAAKAL